MKFKFVDDIVRGIIMDFYYAHTNYELFNLGNNQMVTLPGMIERIEPVIRKRASIGQVATPPADVSHALAGVIKSKAILGYKPFSFIESGIKAHIEYFRK